MAAKSSAIAPSELMYVLVAATACSSPASSGSTASLATASGEAGSLVIATVGRPCRPRLVDHRLHVRRLARLRDPDDERAVEPRRLFVERVERRRRERDRNPMGAPEHVLRVARGIRRAAPRGDQDVLHVRAPEERRDRLGFARWRSSSRASASGCSASSRLEMRSSRRHHLRSAGRPTASSDARLPPYVDDVAAGARRVARPAARSR